MNLKYNKNEKIKENLEDEINYYNKKENLNIEKFEKNNISNKGKLSIEYDNLEFTITNSPNFKQINKKNYERTPDSKFINKKE